MKNLLMPESMTGGTLARWFKQVGDQVTAGEAMAEIETDKAAMQIEAPCDGVLVKIQVPEATAGIAENTVLAVIE